MQKFSQALPHPLQSLKMWQKSRRGGIFLSSIRRTLIAHVLSPERWFLQASRVNKRVIVTLYWQKPVKANCRFSVRVIAGVKKKNLFTKNVSNVSCPTFTQRKSNRVRPYEKNWARGQQARSAGQAIEYMYVRHIINTSVWVDTPFSWWNYLYQANLSKCCDK